ncbi:hypothetical protein SLA2020_110470 [Shorea laevis]
MVSLSVPCLLFYVTAFSLMGCVWSASSMSPRESHMFLSNIQYQCSPFMAPCPPLEVDGNFLDRALTSKQTETYISLLFYASWCPFSHVLRLKFDILSSMFPQIEHFVVEQSNAPPSIFSRYGIHSLPSILIVNQTSRVRYHGPKDLISIAQFYQKATGLEPVRYVAEKEPNRLVDSRNHSKQSWNKSCVNELVKQEPYLAFSVVFLCLRVLLSIFPKVQSRLKAFWSSFVLHLNLEIFGETSQLFGRALHMIDVRRIWTKLQLCKTRNFHRGAKNAHVWASLASVSLGESSSVRLSNLS